MTNSASPAKASDEPGQPTLAKQRVDQVSGLIWIAVGAFVLYHAWSLTYTDDYGPSAGFFPVWLGAIIVLLGVILLVKSTWLETEVEHLSFFSTHAVFQMGLIMAGLVGFILLIERVGFFLSVGLLFFFLLTAVERRGWKFSLAVAIVAGLALWGLFDVALKLQFPPGLLQKLMY
jgi:putative tricarboxylic transport membrane protein